LFHKHFWSLWDWQYKSVNSEVKDVFEKVFGEYKEE
jgi:hypothetical protein